MCAALDLTSFGFGDNPTLECAVYRRLRIHSGIVCRLPLSDCGTVAFEVALMGGG
jgi:hypothetical protein